MIIHLQTSRWRPGQRLAIGAATAALVVAVAWASLAERGAPTRGLPRSIAFEAAATAPDRRNEPFDARASMRAAVLRTPAPAPVAAEGGAVPSAPPFQYVGHWKEHGVTTVVLSDRGHNLLVRVPGAFDDRYHVVAVDEHRLVLKVLPLGIVQTLMLSPGAPWTVRDPVRPAPATPAAPVAVAAPEAQAPWVRTAVRRKAGDAESSMEAPGLPVAPTGTAVSTVSHAVPSGDPEPEN